MDFNDLSPEMQEKIKAAETPEDIFALAREMDYKLSDEEIEEISGGRGGDWYRCRRFGGER